MSCGQDSATTHEESACRRQQGRCWRHFLSSLCLLLVHTCSASLELSWLHRAVEAGHPFYHMYRLCLLG